LRVEREEREKITQRRRGHRVSAEEEKKKQIPRYARNDSFGVLVDWELDTVLGLVGATKRAR
jgi:hypothetical protein